MGIEPPRARRHFHRENRSLAKTPETVGAEIAPKIS